jgi:hypothetical protein
MMDKKSTDSSFAPAWLMSHFMHLLCSSFKKEEIDTGTHEGGHSAATSVWPMTYFMQPCVSLHGDKGIKHRVHMK